jgi:hypothetical protein
LLLDLLPGGETLDFAATNVSNMGMLWLVERRLDRTSALQILYVARKLPPLGTRAGPSRVSRFLNLSAGNLTLNPLSNLVTALLPFAGANYVPIAAIALRPPLNDAPL